MNTQPTSPEDPLEALLCKNQEPLADDGFSARILAALPSPAPKPHKYPNRRVVVCSLGAITGLIWAVTTSGLPHASELTTFRSAVISSTKALLNLLSDPSILALSALILASLAIAFAREIMAKLE
jgi:hypothetical protein